LSTQVIHALIAKKEAEWLAYELKKKVRHQQ
jgi:hypothetical protein